MTTPPALPLRARTQAVDALRGLGLLGAALAGSVAWLTGRPEGPTLRPVASGPDRVLDVLVVLLVDNRVLPLFALLLGYGAARLHARLAPVLGHAGVRRVLVRRGLALLGLGALHAVLVSDNDLLGPLGVLLLLTALLVGARGGALVLVASLVSPGLLLLGALDGLGGQLGGLPDQSASYPVAVVDRAGNWFANLVLLLPLGTVGLLAPVLLGVLLARSGWLDRPQEHRRPLTAVAVAGCLVAVLGAVPLALVAGRLAAWPTTWDAGAGSLSWATGVAGALGVACAAALLLSRLPQRLVVPLAATGRLALSGYLLQSLLLAIVAAPWAGARGAVWGSCGLAAVAVLAWLGTVALAVRWEATGGRGPAEVLLRRWSYRGTSSVPAPSSGRASSGGPQPSEVQGRDRSSAT